MESIPQPSNISIQNSLSLLNLFLQADIVVQAIILILVIFSIISWVIIFKKYVMLRTQIVKTDKFVENIKLLKSTNELHQHIHDDQCFIAKIYISGLTALQSDNLPLDNQKEYILQSINIEYHKTIDILESQVEVLATIGSSAPFIGLLGTVWGIMNSFQAISNATSNNLATIGPGIAEALLATAIGLITAIPATIFYNKFTVSIAKLSNKFNELISKFEIFLMIK
ncbi:MotA/TolQ/ExbB proton channel family protein [Neoehrlichia mikurensis]|uniref:MotA/TolQ/ExbB proton channel family protein n=1 Tax=Neoehrlichia mikurensis TaxID=89586 RepID=A0A9Q9F4J3_9RICK|nr:MotA/TolQ/ExbB proton channel family protein [Neoehrlichia mikurensis]QXK92120.1 MotA/TolQ/ExbB proton channel family protein [Neoehrlichia mikurensis]QXK92577.1 MotA/TolQ/ExbB proton channel family protein [Neoehrlichia mikurensis]QXK93814.1 MotA/TolQ/ExbB proton channel family protein [Neoehrlichia mikurensis]UTO55191.1 MotA/TolQ/ExbB proton channel family protein [Neoehrlichia mikurensis]UTO56111.1 MotA/TolQ/ExbB proton channel family protein [Neoehrlichia mikurensis]